MNRKSLLLLAGTIFCTAVIGCSKSDSKSPDKVDRGKVEDSVYSNKYFGMILTLPEGWYVQTADEQEQLTETGGELLAGDDEGMRAAMKAAKPKTVNMLGAFQHPVGSPVDFNANIMIVAESLSGNPGIEQGSDYLFHLRRFVGAGAMDVAFGEISKKTLGGVEFDVQLAETRIGPVVVRQAYYVAVMKGYALCVITSWGDDEQLAIIEGILDTVEFNQQ